MPKRPANDERLWRCPQCGRGFANRNQSHFCGRHDLERHFDGKEPKARELYEAFVQFLRRSGPVTVLPEKTRIAFQVRMSFAAISVRRSYLIGHLVLARRTEDPRFVRIDTISLRNHVHHFRLSELAQLDTGFGALVKEAYAVGEQKHLTSKGP
jgi:Domain of unknown function (DUF5655)